MCNDNLKVLALNSISRDIEEFKNFELSHDQLEAIKSSDRVKAIELKVPLNVYLYHCSPADKFGNNRYEWNMRRIKRSLSA